MNLLKRELAPITPEAWAQIDEEAKRVLKLHLAGRKFVDFSGPHGDALGAVNTGRLAKVDPSMTEVRARVRLVQPLIELRVPFELDIDDLDDASRGATDLDLDPLIAAAARIARAEDQAIFRGWSAAGIHGILDSTDLAPMAYADPAGLPLAVSGAKETLRRAGVDGPYALVLGPRPFDELQAAAEDGYPIQRRVASLVERIIWAPALEDDGVLVSLRGGDFELSVGRDLGIGFRDHDGERVRLYLTESFTFRVLERGAAVGILRGK